MQKELVMIQIVNMQSPASRIHHNILRVMLFQLGRYVVRKFWHIEALLVVKLVRIIEPLVWIGIFEVTFVEIGDILDKYIRLFCVVLVNASENQIRSLGRRGLLDAERCRLVQLDDSLLTAWRKLVRFNANFFPESLILIDNVNSIFIDVLCIQSFDHEIVRKSNLICADSAKTVEPECFNLNHGHRKLPAVQIRNIVRPYFVFQVEPFAVIERAPPLIQSSTTVHEISDAAHTVRLSLLYHVGKSHNLPIFSIDNERFIAEYYVTIIFLAGSAAYEKLTWL